MDLKHICFIVEGYPTKTEPIFTFVKELIISIANQGIKCSVIAPQSVTNKVINKSEKRPTYWIDTTDKGYKIDIYQPKYLSVSNLKLNKNSISYNIWKNTIINCFNKLDIKPDVFYGHFWHSGLVTSILSEKYNIPAFVATGESKIVIRDLFNNKLIDENISKIKGVICVSTKNKHESIQLNLTQENKCVVIPNAVDKNVFYKKDKNQCRNELGFNKNDFIVAFTGTFNERKGSLRLSDALEDFDDVQSIFIGSGKDEPMNNNILFKGRLSHYDIATYLNAADVFVLPTIAEGCSNAIIEAMACGLPIISSNKTFNDDILTESNSIRINPMKTREIRDAISYLKKNEKVRKKMGIQALNDSEGYDINIRANKIIKYIKEVCEMS